MPRDGTGLDSRPGAETGAGDAHPLEGLAVQDGTLTKIEAALDTLRPYIASHRGTVEVVDFDELDGTLLLRMGGTCHGCSASTITLKQGIEERLRHTVPEVKRVEAL